MPWLQIKIPTLPQHTEILEDVLMLAGCQAVTLLDTADEPVFEPIRGTTPLWTHTTVQGLFEQDIDAETLTQIVTNAIDSNAITAGSVSTEILEDKDWEREWMDNFKPIECGPRLWIVPSWLSAPDKTAVNLKLDPGLAFGTGTHPTTYLCLKWLDQEVKGDEQVLDFGCGSGILGLAAILLGARKMDGIDIDPQALTATKSNAELNDIKNNQYQVTTDENELEAEYDIVIANILAGTLCDLAPQIIHRVKSGGKIVLSGILEHQADAVTKAYQQHVRFEPIQSMEGWVCLSGRKS